MLDYVIIPPSRFDAVIGHLRVNFPDEPLNASVGLCLHGIPCPLLEHHDLKTMEDGLSVMVIDKENDKVSVDFCRFGSISNSPRFLNFNLIRLKPGQIFPSAWEIKASRRKHGKYFSPAFPAGKSISILLRNFIKRLPGILQDGIYELLDSNKLAGFRFSVVNLVWMDIRSFVNFSRVNELAD